MIKLTKKEVEGIALKLQNQFRDSWDIDPVREPDPYWVNIVQKTLRARDALFKVTGTRWEIRSERGIYHYGSDEGHLAKGSVNPEEGEKLVRVTAVARKRSKRKKTNECAACGKKWQGKVSYGIHRDGFGIGPEVDLCTPCGGSALPTCETLWREIAERRKSKHGNPTPVGGRNSSATSIRTRGTHPPRDAQMPKVQEETTAVEVLHHAVLCTHTTLKNGILTITPSATFLCGAQDGNGYENKRKVTCPKCKQKLKKKP